VLQDFEMSTPSEQRLSPSKICSPAYQLSPSNRLSASKRGGGTSDMAKSARSPVGDKNRNSILTFQDLVLDDSPLLASHSMTPSEVSIIRYGASFGYRGAGV
jgi:hypothetical protein